MQISRLSFTGLGGGRVLTMVLKLHGASGASASWR